MASYIILKVRPGTEREISKLIENKLKRLVIVPNNNTARTRSKLLYSGYVFIECNEENLESLKMQLKEFEIKGYPLLSKTNYRSALDRSSAIPYFLSDKDIEHLSQKDGKTQQSFKVGDEIEIMSGLLKDCTGKIYAINTNVNPITYKVAVNVGQTEIFTTIEQDKIIQMRKND